MSAKKFYFAALLTLGCSICPAWAQGPSDHAAPPVKEGPSEPAADNGPPVSTGLSDWITYARHNCCLGPVGGNTPLMTEFFLRAGPSFAVGRDYFDHVLSPGWMIQGGARLLCFNSSWRAAWAIDASLSNHYNSSNDFTTTTIGGQTVTVRSLNRTFVNLGLGREWYLWAPANAPGSKLRVGADGGARYGSSSLEFNEIRHTTDTIAGAYASLHSDLEIPCTGCTLCKKDCKDCGTTCDAGCIFLIGIRGEWSYTWSDILGGKSDMQDVNVMINLGVRY